MIAGIPLAPNGHKTPGDHGRCCALPVYENRGALRPGRNAEMQNEVCLLGSRYFKLDVAVRGIRTFLAEGNLRAVLNPANRRWNVKIYVDSVTITKVSVNPIVGG